MKRAVLVGIVLAWILVGCGGTSEPEALPPGPLPTASPVPTATQPVSAAPEPAWQEFISDGGGFAILMPSEPVEQIEPASAGDSTEHHMFLARYGEAAAFAVAYTDLPEQTASVEPEAIQDILDLGRDSALANMGGTLLAEERISLDGYPGRHIEFELPVAQFPHGGQGILRVYLVGARAYQVMALGPDELFAGEEVDRFVASFRLIDAPVTGLASPDAVLQTVFDAARSGDLALLADLCDPQGENDGDTQELCDLAVADSGRETFVEFFEKARIAGPTTLSPDGSTANVPFFFGPEGDQEETMVLILRDGRWYLFEF